MKKYSILFLSLLAVIVVNVVVVFGQDETISEKSEKKDVEQSGENREMREYVESWHGIQTIPEGATDWIPRDPYTNRPIKRRRLRKRKRRPPVVTFLDDSKEQILQPATDNLDQAGNIRIPLLIEEKIQSRLPELKDHLTPPEEEVYLDEGQQQDRVTLMDDKFVEEADRFTLPKKRKRPNINGEWDEHDEVEYSKRKKVQPERQDSEKLTVISNPDLGISPLSATINFGPETIPPSKIEDKNEKSTIYYGNPKPVDEEQTKTTEEPDKITNLKAILKQNGGLSLSEVLQKKNLTLAELLKGDANAIKALTEPPKTTMETESPEILTEKVEMTTKYKRLPPSSVLKKNLINRKYEQNDEEFSDTELAEAQRKRQNLLQAFNKIPANTKHSSFKEPSSTEKSILTSPDPKEAISSSSEIEINENNTEIPQGTTTTTQKVTTNSQRAVLRVQSRLPLTNAKLNKITYKRMPPKYVPVIKEEDTTKEEEENYPKLPIVPLRPIKIDVKDLFGPKNTENQSEEKDEPYRMEIDLDNLTDKSTTTTTPRTTTTSTTPSTTTTTTSTTSTTIKPQVFTEDTEKLQPFTAKEEILQILRDPKARQDLTRVLEARNMTVQELIEQRERGSSQRHLADIFHNNTREPEPIDEPLEGQISSEVFTSFPIFSRHPKNLFDEKPESQENVETIKATNTSSIFPSFKIEVPEENTTNSWSNLYPNLFNIETKNTIENAEEILPSSKEKFVNEMPLDILTQEDFIQRVDDNNERMFSSNEQLDFVVDEDSHKIFKNIPSGVKSAIIASLLIVGLSVMVFITILVIFKWTQKKKQGPNYRESLKPQMFNVKKRNIKNFVVETMGKARMNYYRSQMRGMSDSIWEKDSDRKLSF
ncbi:DNA ligase 1 [Sitophilus oryzae]|uniref:DNA ligase 1 n=1 Tax=Sitophilus oryzae TaxID=7048 RepID=A0A6J2X2U6_SITOR|nr:DNA ligase 1 [Sitophilus oryzae]